MPTETILAHLAPCLQKKFLDLIIFSCPQSFPLWQSQDRFKKFKPHNPSVKKKVVFEQISLKSMKIELANSVLFFGLVFNLA